MDAIVTKLVEQAPTSVALIVVVVYFISYLEKRDRAVTGALDKITDRLQSLENNQIEHNTSMLAAVNEMRSRVTTNRRARKGGSDGIHS